MPSTTTPTDGTTTVEPVMVADVVLDDAAIDMAFVTLEDGSSMQFAEEDEALLSGADAVTWTQDDTEDTIYAQDREAGTVAEDTLVPPAEEDETDDLLTPINHDSIA